MNMSVTRTRVVVPQRRPDLLSRKRVLAHLQNQTERKVIIIVAPAGYGKTSVLLDFVAQSSRSVCWYSVDSLDINLQRFLAHFLASLKQRFENFGAESQSALKEFARVGGSLDSLVTTIVNELYERVLEPFTLVVDDFHLVIDEESIRSFINSFIQQVGENCQIILSSRKLLSLPDLPLFVARSMVGGLSMEELAFQTDELQALMLQNYRQVIDDSSALEIIDMTEGWITGVLLSAHSANHRLDGQSSTMRAAGIDVYDYLAQQVLGQHEELIQKFLLRTSLMEEFSETFCQKLLTPTFYPIDTDWRRTVEEVVTTNLFILPVEDGEAWYRYHNLFQEFLQRQMHATAPEEEAVILEKLAEYYSAEKEWEKAHRVRQRQGNVQKVAEVIERAGLFLVQSYQWDILEKWLDELPATVRIGRPYLQALEGYALTVRGDCKEGLFLLNRAIEELTHETVQLQLAACLVWRCVVHRQNEDFTASLSDANEALRLLHAATTHPEAVPDSAAILRAEALNSKGICYSMLGEPEEGVANMEQAASQYLALGNNARAAVLINDVATAHMNAGRYFEARRRFHEALEQTQALQQILPQVHILNNLGVLYHLLGDYERAHAQLERAVELARSTNNLFFQALSLISLGDIFADLKDVKSADCCYAEALALAKKSDSLYLLLYIDLARSQLACTKNEWALAYEHLDAVGRAILERRSVPEWNLYRIALGSFYLERGNHEKAVEIFEEAVSGTESSGQHIEEIVSRLMLAAACHRARQNAQIFEQLLAASSAAQTLETWQPLVVKGQLCADFLREMDQQQIRDLATGYPGAGAEAADEIVAFCQELTRCIENFQQASQEILARLLQRGSAPVTAAANERSSVKAELVIRTLGRIEIFYKDALIHNSQWQSQTARNLFLCLVAHERGMTKEEVGELFWPESAPAQLKIRFKNAIYRLRRALFPEAIRFEDEVYQFNRNLDYHCDAEAFQQALANAKEAGGLQQKRQAYLEAIRLYRGEYLPEVEGMWAWLERERLGQLYVDACLRMADLHCDSGEYPEALELCQTALAVDPCLEDAHRTAMRIHAASGNRAAVIRQYELCETSLREEFDASPSEQTHSLFLQLTD